MSDNNLRPNRPVETPDNGVQNGNPFLPLWERVPDGEPRIFTDPWSGEERMYVYGSHDTEGFFCGPDHVVWSAPVSDLTNWRHEGVAFRVESLEGLEYVDENGNRQRVRLQPGHALYAPDVVYNPTTGKYTMLLFLAAKEPASLMFAAASDTPGGPFAEPHFVGMGFDPAVLVDDACDAKGRRRMYLYWSVEANRSGWAAELDPETVTIIPGTLHCPMKDGMAEGANTMFSNWDAPFHYFEGPSIRKIGGAYVLSYARSKPDGTSPHGYLAEIAYAFSDNPFGDPAVGGGWEYGGVIIDNKGEYVENPYAPGEITHTFYGGNNHGGLIKAGDNWYQIYHRNTNKMFKRQAMAVRVDVSFDAAGKIKISQGELTSEGFRVDGLDPFRRLAAASLCYALPAEKDWRKPAGPVITSNDARNFDPAAPRDGWYAVSNIKNHTWLGYKYYNFKDGVSAPVKLQLTLREFAPATVNIYAADARCSANDPEKAKLLIGRIELTGADPESHTVSGEITRCDALKGKKAIYLEFVADGEENVAELNELVFATV